MGLQHFTTVYQSRDWVLGSQIVNPCVTVALPCPTFWASGPSSGVTSASGILCMAVTANTWLKTFLLLRRRAEACGNRWRARKHGPTYWYTCTACTHIMCKFKLETRSNLAFISTLGHNPGNDCHCHEINAQRSMYSNECLYDAVFPTPMACFTS